MNIKYDEPIEVTKVQYDKVRVKYGQIIATRVTGGKYYIKLWVMKYKNELIKDLQES